MTKEDIYITIITVIAIFALGYLMMDQSEATRQALQEFAFLPRF